MRACGTAGSAGRSGAGGAARCPPARCCARGAAAARSAGPPRSSSSSFSIGGSSLPVLLAPQRPQRRTRTRAASGDSGGAAAPAATQPAAGASLEAVCAELDAILARAVEDRSQEAAARGLVEKAQAAGQLRAFGRARQLPKRLYTIDELRLNKIEPEKLLAPRDDSLNRVRNILQAAAAAGLGAIAVASGFDLGRVLGVLVSATFALVADQVANGGGGEALVVDTAGRLLDSRYASRVALHEAGHLLVAYLLGVMPKAYTLSSLDAFVRYRALNVQAGTTFCDTAFEAEVAAGRLGGGTLDRYACVALAGVVTEYLRFGQAEGGVGDVGQLDRLFSALGFTQKKADGQVRWAVLNVAMLLRRHAPVHDALAAAMARGESVGACVQIIERGLAGNEADVLGPGEVGSSSAAFISSSTSSTSADSSQQEA